MNRDELRADAKRRAQAAQVVAPVPEWPGAYVRALTAGEVDSNTNLVVKDATRRGIVNMAILSLCDETGARLYDATNADDLAEIDALPSSLLIAVNNAAGAVNALSPEGQAEAGNG